MADTISPFASQGQGGNLMSGSLQLDQYQRYSAENEQASTAGAMKNVGEAIKKNPSNDQFSKGMKMGYQVVEIATGPLLAWHAARSEKKILGYQKELSDMAAQSYQTAAEDVLRSGNRQVAQITYANGQQKAANRVHQSAAGVRAGASGSSAEVFASQDIITEMQTNQVLANAIAQSWGYQRQATNARANSLAIKAARSNIKPWAAALSSMISTALNMGKTDQSTGNSQGGDMMSGITSMFGQGGGGEGSGFSGGIGTMSGGEWAGGAGGSAG